MLSVETLLEKARSVEAVAIQRLRANKKAYNLVTYEGTILDQLCLHFTQRVWKQSDYQVICSIRPCMARSLQVEVEEFARANNHPLIGFEDDCEIDRERKRFIHAQCGNVSTAVCSYLRGRNGQLVLSGLLNNWSFGYFSTVNRELETFQFEQDQSRDSCIFKPGPGSSVDWQTLFLFEGFYPVDMLAASCLFMPSNIAPYHIPLCYLGCHNEIQQASLLDRLEEIKRLMETRKAE